MPAQQFGEPGEYEEFVRKRDDRIEEAYQANTGNTQINDLLIVLKLLSLLIFSLQAHKSAWPFMEPVDPEEAPDYYKVIKEPMGVY